MTRNNRLYVIGSVTLMVALVLAGWFIGAQPFITAAAAADSERANVEVEIQTRQAQLAELEKEKAKLPALQKQLDGLTASIPSSSSTSGFITDLNALAVSTGVQITGITVSDPQAYTVPASAAAAQQATTTTSTPSPAPSATPTAAPNAPSTTAAAPPAVTNPLITPANFVGIQVTVDLAGSNDAVLGFTKGLQSGPRLFLVTSYSSSRSVDGGDPSAVTAHVGGLIYVLRTAG